MTREIEITKIERTDDVVDNSAYEFKIPYEVVDDYGNVAKNLYRKETHLCVEYDAKILQEQAQKEKELQDILDKKDKIEEIS